MPTSIQYPLTHDPEREASLAYNPENSAQATVGLGGSVHGPDKDCPITSPFSCFHLKCHTQA